MLRRIIALCSCVASLAMPVHAQDAPPTTTHVQASLISEVEAVTPETVFWVAVQLQHEEGWHTYWQNPGDSGLATKIEWQLPAGFSADDIHWPTPHRISIGTLVNYGYEGTVQLLVPVTAPKDLGADQYNFTATIHWLACKDICIPESATLALTLPRGEGQMQESPRAAQFREWLKPVPAPFNDGASYTVNEGKLMINLPRTGALAQADEHITLFPITNGVIENAAIPEVRLTQNFIYLTFPRIAQTALPEEFKAVAAFDAGGTQKAVQLALKQEKTTSSEHMPDITFSMALWFALLGGLILNIMPCVLPVLSLKAVQLTKKSGQGKLAVLTEGIAYTAGVQISFAVLALVLILLQHGGQMAGWGYQLQSPLFVTALIYVIFITGLNLSGMFELPVIAGDINHKVSQKQSWAGSFFAGMLATLVATPCTAPFMAPAIGYAFTLPPVQSFLVFQALGFGLALPYLLISIFPFTLKLLPKPGAWMDSFKQFLAFPMYATAVWLLWVLAQQAGANALVIVLFGCVWIGFGLWVWRKLSGNHAVMRFSWLLLVVAVGVSTIPMLSAVQKRPDSCITDMQRAQAFSESKLAELRAAGTPVFVDVTAAWCITCQINERTALSSPAVLKAMADKNITFMKADWTNKDSAITAYLTSFGRGGVPLYVYYPPNSAPVVLPQLLTEQKLLDALK